MGSTTQNPIATVTNNSGYDVDMYDVFNPSTDPNTPGPLTYTFLRTVPNGAAQQVPTKHTVSQVQAMFTGTIKALNGNYYQQFPVAVLAVSPPTNSTSNAFTITSDMRQSMVDSFTFLKYVQANPSSQLATKFNTALGDKKRQGDAVNQLFKSTGSFQLCTMTTWTAVFTWQAQFTNPWQGTYYLYSLGSNSADSTSSSSAPALVATLAITASAAASSAVLTMAGTGNQNTPVVMAGDGTMQEENQGTGNLSVALSPTWLNLAPTALQNGNAASSYVIGASFTGTISGVEVAGNCNQLTISSSSDNSNSPDGWSIAKYVLDSLQGLTTTLVNIGMLYYMVKDFKQAAIQRKNDAQKIATSKSDATERERQIKDESAREASQVDSMLESIKPNIELVEQQYRKVTQAEAIQIQLTAVKEQQEKLVKALDIQAPTKAVEDAAKDIQKARGQLVKAADIETTEEDRKTALIDATATLKSISAKIEQLLNGEGSQLADEEKATLKKTKEALDRALKQSNVQEKMQEKQERQNSKDVEVPIDGDQVGNSDAEDKPLIEGGR